MNGIETNNQPQSAQAPRMPEPQNPGFMNADPNDLTFLFNEESGQLEIGTKPSIPQQQDQPFQDAVATQQSQQAQQQVDQPANGYDERFSKLEGAFSQLVDYLRQKEQQPLNNLSQPQVQDQNQEVDYSGVDFQDPKNLVALINLTVDNKLKQPVQQMATAVGQVQAKNNFDFAAAKYGQDFLNKLPQIQLMIQNGILKSDPNMSFESIYLTLKQMESMNGNGQTAKSDSTVPAVNGSNGTSRQPQTANALVQKANALSTESGGVQRNIINNARQRSNSVEDAVDQAWNELFGGRA